MNDRIKIERHWAMPSADTLTIKPLRELVKWYLKDSKVSVDPFARNSRLATYTNDLNPETQAEYHLPALEFLQMLVARAVRADLIIFDPPYSRRQIIESYQSIGKEFTNEDSQNFTTNWREERNLMDLILEPDGIVMSFGWHTNGMSEGRGYRIERILLVAHGGGHHDAICTVERKLPKRAGLFEFAKEKSAESVSAL